jgi:flagellar biosynthesis/type III secretory pathway protein FliH
MSLAHKYEEFGESNGLLLDELNQDGRDIESEKLQSFEDGYQAGWEDSVKAQSEFEKKFSSELAKNLQDASFGYHEARSTLTQGLKPLFEGILSKLLPEITRTSIGPYIVEQLSGMVRDNSDQIIEIVVSPQEIESLQSVLQEQISEPFVLVALPDLREGQAYVRLGSHEREIDFGKMIQEIRKSANNLFEREQVDG